MPLFTIGPVEMFPDTLEVRSRQVPYFRNAAFSQVVFESCDMIQKLMGAEEGARTILLTSSGTGAMEATVMNCLGTDDHALVINGGSFGARFCQILERHHVPFDSVDLASGEALVADRLAPYEGAGCTALLVNLDETSTGQLYDLEMLSAFCRHNGMLLIVDAISAFLSDPIDMTSAGIDVLIVSSQKALSLAPGLSCVTLSPRMVERVVSRDACPCMYFDFVDYLRNGERGQTPFTPAVGVVYELHQRLGALLSRGGAAAEIERVRDIALDFRSRLAALPVRLPEYPLSNAVTPVILDDCDARRLIDGLESGYGIVINPCGGAHAHDMVRIAHVGNHSTGENPGLVQAISEVLSAS